VDNFTRDLKKKNCLENYLLRFSEYNRKWITKFSDIYDFKELQRQTMKYRKEDTNNKKVKWMEIKCLPFLKTDPDSIQFKYDFGEEFRTVKVTASKKQGRPSANDSTEIPKQSRPNFPFHWLIKTW